MKAPWLTALACTTVLGEQFSKQKSEDNRLPVANVSSESSVTSSKLHCVQQLFAQGGSAAGGHMFGNDSVSSSVKYVTTAGNSTDYMSAPRFCHQAGFDSCDALRDTVSNLAMFGVGYAQNKSFDSLFEKLYDQKHNTSAEVKPQHFKIPDEFKGKLHNNKSDERGPTAIRIKSQKFDDQFQVSARVAKKSCKKTPCEYYSKSAIRISFTVSGQGNFHDLEIPAIFVANGWYAQAQQMGDPSTHQVQYVGTLPRTIDVIGQVAAMMGSSSSVVTLDDDGGISSDAFNVQMSLPTSLRLDYRVEILPDWDDDKSRIDICGPLPKGVNDPEASELGKNLTTATSALPLKTADHTAPPASMTNRTKSSAAAAGHSMSWTVYVLVGVLGLTICMF